MNAEFRKSFLKDLEHINDQPLKERVKDAILRVEAAGTLQDIENIRKLRGGDRHYRIRVGSFRIGLIIEGNAAIFVRLPLTRNWRKLAWSRSPN